MSQSYLQAALQGAAASPTGADGRPQAAIVTPERELLSWSLLDIANKELYADKVRALSALGPPISSSRVATREPPGLERSPFSRPPTPLLRSCANCPNPTRMLQPTPTCCSRTSPRSCVPAWPLSWRAWLRHCGCSWTRRLGSSTPALTAAALNAWSSSSLLGLKPLASSSAAPLRTTSVSLRSSPQTSCCLPTLRWGIPPAHSRLIDHARDVFLSRNWLAFRACCLRPGAHVPGAARIGRQRAAGRGGGA
jgi:hypothetical protein